MTGYTVHTGSTEQFSEGWDHIFGGAGSRSEKPATKKSAAKTSSKGAASQSKTVKKPAATKKRPKDTK